MKWISSAQDAPHRSVPVVEEPVQVAAGQRLVGQASAEHRVVDEVAGQRASIDAFEGVKVVPGLERAAQLLVRKIGR